MLLNDRIALITGGGSGIGRATALLFAQSGAKVVVADLRGERAEETARLINQNSDVAMPIAADVSRRDAVHQMIQQAYERFGRIDILVNNAAIAEGDDILTFDEDVWQKNLDVVLKSVFLCSKVVLPGMIERQRGAIVNIASVNGLTGLGEEAYGAAKAGVINLTQNMAVKYGQHQVRANVICPGTIHTPIWGPRLEADPTIFERLAAWYPLGRVGQPEDVANAALFLASDAAAWITGAVLNVDGGLMAGNYRMGQALESKDIIPGQDGSI